MLRPAYSVSGKEGLAFLPEALVGVHAAAVVAEERLGHERGGLAVSLGDVLDDVAIDHHLIGRLDQRLEAVVNFRLAGGGDFMVLLLDGQRPTVPSPGTISVRMSWSWSSAGTGK